MCIEPTKRSSERAALGYQSLILETTFSAICCQFWQYFENEIQFFFYVKEHGLCPEA
jgi:hypothetical protein